MEKNNEVKKSIYTLCALSACYIDSLLLFFAGNVLTSPVVAFHKFSHFFYPVCVCSSGMNEN